MNFAINPPSNKINKFSLTILSQKHAHCEPFSSLPFLLFNKYENGLESERESVQINSSGFRFNVSFVDCTSVFVKSVLETSLSFTYILQITTVTLNLASHAGVFRGARISYDLP